MTSVVAIGLDQIGLGEVGERTILRGRGDRRNVSPIGVMKEERTGVTSKERG